MLFMEKKNILNILFAIILAVGFLLRFYKLGEVPFGFYQDESAIGYNAYSLIQTGKDEHGNSWPLYFKSFGDWKLPVYIYLTIPAILLLGMTELAVRLPSAIFGFLTIIVFYYFLKTTTKSQAISLIAAAILAINPWHIHYSRATFEVTLALFFLLLGGTLIYQSSQNSKSGFFFAGTIFFILGFYSYNLTRLLAPAWYAATFYYYHGKITKLKITEILFTIFTAGLALLPFIASYNNPGGATSAAGTLIWSSSAVQAPLVEFRSYLTALPPVVNKLLFNSFLLNIRQYAANLASYLSASFFFVSGSSHGNHGIGNIGQFYIFELPVFMLGLWSILHSLSVGKKLLITWASLTIAIAALTRDIPHATRSFFLIPSVAYIISHGWIFIIMKLALLKKPLQVAAYSAASLVVIVTIIYYLASYFLQFPRLYAKSWRSADKPLALFLTEKAPQVNQIIIDETAGFMYTSLLFFGKYPPQQFIDEVKWSQDDSEGFSRPERFGKYTFRKINWDQDVKLPNSLIITSPEKKPDQMPPLQSFSYPLRPVVFALKQELIKYPIAEIPYVAVLTAQ